MNRNQEYLELTKELEEIKAPGGSVLRAMARQKKERRSKYFLRPLAGVAAAFALFVLLINVSPTVAKACEGIPLLSSLTGMLRFSHSHSLAEAVENDYYQRVDQQQTIDGVTVSVDYLIMDEKSLTVFYRVDVPKDSKLSIGEWGCVDGADASGSFGAILDPDYKGYISTFVFSGNTPEHPQLNFALLDDEEATGKTFSFQLEPTVLPTKHIDADQTLELDGQRIRITGIDVYPSMVNISLETDPDNTATLDGINLYVMTDDGTRYEMSSLGSAVNSPIDDDPDRYEIHVDSPYFQNPSSITVCVEDTYWGYKQQEKGATSIRFNPTTGTATGLPSDIEIVDYSRQENGDWHLALRTRNTARKLCCIGFYLDTEEYWRDVKDEDPDPNVVAFTTHSVDTDEVMLWLDYDLHSDQPITATYELNP